MSSNTSLFNPLPSPSSALSRSRQGLFSGVGVPLPLALDGRRLLLNSSAGRIAYYHNHSRDGRPLLLVHSVNAAASAAEMRPLFEHYATRRPVYALELPGFGASERSDRDYTPRLMTDAVLAMQAEIERLHGNLPIDAVGLSLGCEFVARAATERRAAFRTVAMVSPTGLDGHIDRYGLPCSSRETPWMHRLLRSSALGRTLYQQLVRPGTVRFFLKRAWGGASIDEALSQYCVTTARMPGAEHAPLAFLSGQPFSNDINAVYDDLVQPVWVAHGTRGSLTDFRRAQPLVDAGRWRASAFETGSMPYFEQLQAFVECYEDFLQASAAAPARKRA